MAGPTKITVAELDLGLNLLEQKVKQAKQLLNLDGFKSQVPKRLKQDFEEIEKSLDSLYKSKPGANASTQDLQKYTKQFEKLGNQLESTISHISGTKIDVSGLQDAIESLKELKKKAEEASEAYTKYKENLGTKGAFTGDELGELAAAGKAKKAPTGYRNDLLAADKKAVAIAQNGGSRAEIEEAFAPIKGKLGKRVEDIGDNDIEQVRQINDVIQAIVTRVRSLAGQAQYLKGLEAESEHIGEELNSQTQGAIDNVKTKIGESAGAMGEASLAAEDLTNKYRQMGDASKEVDKVNKSLERISGRIQQLFSTTTIFMTIRRIVRGAIQDFKELDKQFNDIAIVSKYSTKEMWASFASVNKMAQEYGVTTKDILEVQNLYYHQGKQMAEVNKLTAQTLTLAKITGMDYADATNKMTAALNAYKISAEDASRVTDTVAALSANAATSSEELMTALTKTASIAANAGMSLENTEVFLTKMIETTREAPENLGTALKTIIARFGEIKNAIDENGNPIEVADINKVDTALRSIGMTLLNSAGQVKDLDQVFMELSSKWDDLDRNTQRYIATQAAGSRQQSRFIAMMENYDRTLELVEVSQDSAGTGARQLAKAQESIETALNRLKSTWQELYSNVIKSGMIKGVLNLANALLTVLNKLPGPLGSIGLAFSVWGLKTLVVDKGMTSLIRTIKVLTGDMSTYVAAQEAANKNSFFSKLKGGKARLLEYRKAVLGIAAAEGTLTNVSEENVAIKMAQNNLDKESIKNIIEQNTGNASLAETQSAVVATKLEELAVSERLNEQEAVNNVLSGAFVDEKSKEILIRKIDMGLKKQEDVQDKVKRAGMLKTILVQKLANANTTLMTKHGKELIGNIAKQVAENKVAAISWGEVAAATWAALWPLLLITAALGAAILIYKNFIAVTTDHSDAMDKAKEAADDYKESLKELKDLEKDYSTYKELNDKLLLTTDEQEQLAEAIDALLEQYPDLLNYIDEHGNKVLKDNKEIEKAIELKKEETQRLAENSAELKRNLAMQGLSAESTAKKNAQLMGENMAAAYGADISSTWKSAMTVVSKNKGFWEVLGKNYAKDLSKGPWALSSVEFDVLRSIQTVGSVEALLKGEGVNKDTMHGLMGRLTRMSEKDYQKFIKLAQDKNLENIDDLESIFGDIYGKTLGKKYAATFKKNTEQLIPVIEADIKSQGELVKQVLQQQIYDWLNMENYDFKPDSSGFNKLAAAFVASFNGNEEEINQNKEKMINFMKSLNQDEYNKLIAGMNFGNIKLGNFLDDKGKVLSDEGLKKFAGAFTEDEIGKNMLIAYWKDSLSLSDDDIETLKNILAGTGEKVQNITLEQMKATQDKITELSKKTGDEKIAVRLYQEAYRIGKKYDSPDIINLINNSSVDDIADIDTLAKKLQSLGVNSKDAYVLIKNLGGGLKNLPLDNTADMVEYLTKKFEELEDTAESLTKLSEGKGNLSDLKEAINMLTQDKQGADFTATVNDLLKGLTVSSEGFYLSTEQIAKAKKLVLDSSATIGDVEKELLKQSIANTEQEIQADLEMLKNKKVVQEGLLEMTDAQLNDIAASNESAASYIQNLISLRNKWKSQQMNLALIDVTSEYTKRVVAGKEAVDAAEKAKKAWEEFAKWLRDLDIFAPLNKQIESLEEKIEHLNFEIEFSTNINVIEKDIKEQLNLINHQIAANSGGIRAAKQNLQVWKDVLQQRNGKYVSFDEYGNAIVDANKMLDLQKKIRDAKEEDAEVLKQEAEEIEANVKNYEKAKEAVQNYTKALEDNFNALQELLSDTYDKAITLQDKLIEIRQKAEDKELQAVKDKYAKIQEENNKYLDSIRKMVDKEREIRDRQNNEEELKLKQRKLAMLEMSGGSEVEIATLRKEIEQGYQDLNDDNIDMMIQDWEDQNSAAEDAMNKETEFLDNVLAERRESMQVYNDWATKMITTSVSEIMSYITGELEDYKTASDIEKTTILSSTLDMVTKGKAAYNLLATDGIQVVEAALITAKSEAESFEEAVDSYSVTVPLKNGAVTTSICDMSNTYSEMVQNVVTQSSTLIGTMDKVAAAYISAANAAKKFKIATTTETTDVEDDKGIKRISYKERSPDGLKYTDTASNQIGAKEYGTKVGLQGFNYTPGSGYISQDKVRFEPDHLISDTSGYKVTGRIKADDKTGIEYYEILDPYTTKTYWVQKTSIDPMTKTVNARGAFAYHPIQYAKGGMVNFTGPAWVDGTKSKPEAFLSASDTANIAALRDTLSYIYSQPTITNGASNSSVANSTYNITVQVDSISNDYDVDRAISRMENQISKASQYRNINILKKSN